MVVIFDHRFTSFLSQIACHFLW